MQYFCGYAGYDDEKPPFDLSLMVYFRKRLTPEILGEVNEMIIRNAKERQEKEAAEDDDDSDSGSRGNSGTLVADATCAPSNIRYSEPGQGFPSAPVSKGVKAGLKTVIRAGRRPISFSRRGLIPLLTTESNNSERLPWRSPQSGEWKV